MVREFLDIDFLVRKYQRFLIASWDIVLSDSYDEDLKCDWLQVNWELIVESRLNFLMKGSEERINLFHYGDGAAGEFDRVFIESAKSSHEVRCFPKNGNSFYDLVDQADVVIPNDGFSLYQFVSFKEGWFFQEPPFESVQVREMENAVFSVDEVEFKLMAIAK